MFRLKEKNRYDNIEITIFRVSLIIAVENKTFSFLNHETKTHESPWEEKLKFFY